MNLIAEFGHFYSKSTNQDIFYRQRVEGKTIVKTTGNWFYNYGTDRFITKNKLLSNMEADAAIDIANKIDE